jgi:hypothetical protein
MSPLVFAIASALLGALIAAFRPRASLVLEILAVRQQLAVLYTLVACCEKHGVNPIDYVTDVLTRVHSHPAREVLDLLPHRWKPPDDTR